jgi:hypothetical protein
LSTSGQNLTLPPVENLTVRRGDEPQVVTTLVSGYAAALLTSRTWRQEWEAKAAHDIIWFYARASPNFKRGMRGIRNAIDRSDLS